MSCDWNIHCVDCNETLRFNDANHQDTLMGALCDHAAAVAALLPLIKRTRYDLKLETYYGSVDVDWFAAHLGHKLVPIDEYGALITQCHKYVGCVCGSMRRCALDRDHIGDCNPAKEHP